MKHKQHLTEHSRESLVYEKRKTLNIWNLIPGEICTTRSGSHLKIRREKHQNPSQISAANGSQLGAPGGRRPRSSDTPGNPNCQNGLRKPFCFVLATRGRLSREPQSPHLLGAAAESTPNRVHLYTHFISALQILAPAPPSVHILFVLWTSILTTHHISHQPSEVTVTTVISVTMHMKHHFSLKA